jgi:uncharacterized protein with von Willebrand factor type A (vWA) domain
VRAARVERRKCYLYAFAAGTAVAECELGDDAQGLSQLLTFLAFSFRGGTDVAAPLRAALERLTTEDTWASADILMVSDGELPTPPLDRNTMRQLIVRFLPLCDVPAPSVLAHESLRSHPARGSDGVAS